MRLSNRLMAAVAVLSLAAPAAARTTKQYRQFFPGWNVYLRNITDNACHDELLAYQDPEGEYLGPPALLLDCILSEMSEIRKTEMGITAVVLGLLPTMLQQIGPTVSEVGVLASRRPLLAFLLSFAMPSVSTGGAMADPVEGLRRPVVFRMRSLPSARGGWLWVLVSALEYLIALTALGNTLHQISTLALWSISISAMAIQSGAISQTFGPFLWVTLVVPAHLLYFWSFKMQYKKRDGDGERTLERETWLQTIASEFVPCAAGEPMLLTQVHTGLLHFVVEFATDIASLVVFIFGTIVLSSQIFISMADVVPIVGRILASTLVCRLVVLFELHGIREANSDSETKDGVLLSDGPQSGYEQDNKGVLAAQDRAV
ncbi:uncharacterized protein DNG_06712 [Cephalotrichum gorgonifer]|uniref:Uncharacterized protein n=1 Tax=Cephalotrichum gorgonifer TaxID=2041049 RepID=A0AAE8N243_9PEZI|nr:uncharacterized protein DNG_06712 [Cephalotrichum gorgonifer]